ncbi:MULTISPECIES: sulfurtransferase complex subunit TusB [unclassified Pseudoalteromonas]|uniref:sulfurtransferase complex subunit TusB n=1 Tax=unclassified Pseudoalteromonas TaxID=194690 RepID=UPI000E851422|nr:MULTISPECIES: sulfurtransferase complex subunit TusB [unclassified Pseudoalteromonas]HBW99050.1 sulfurtransferase complex subunit TusB [Pseudoalteromonas sp.]MDC9508230.1 sulfurtransferase complex subunit TusB [Pseudoalteromonas sp. Angola-4]MDC9563131.1 sulfurtransferase complex subunit TusB [Pseudoalteromonas sp. GAB2316C]MDC9567509.1 sulfurtransferase complex subunit TusB [Pseudoalteromonas sp. GABNB9D]MDC9571793.1 sulfurtransferase complex subunit TusB [Pseudoalteromonas sp. GABNS16A]|tara:strand:+ start:1865 stop:2131 length:267 start_codon:yes stop_codon:yes gene_type:complete
MSTLHIFSKPLAYYDSTQLENLIKYTDKVLLVGDACYAAKQYFQLNDSLLLLLEDAQARAVKLSSGQTLINYDEFVALTLSTNQSITW